MLKNVNVCAPLEPFGIIAGVTPYQRRLASIPAADRADLRLVRLAHMAAEVGDVCTLPWLERFTDAYQGKPRDEALRLLLPAEYSCGICGALILIDVEAVIRESFFPCCACWDNCPVLLGIFGANGPALMAKQVARVGRRATA